METIIGFLIFFYCFSAGGSFPWWKEIVKLTFSKMFFIKEKIYSMCGRDITKLVIRHRKE